MSRRSGGVESRNSSDLLPAESRAPDGKAELLREMIGDGGDGMISRRILPWRTESAWQR
jgi:hypothetical protein